ncbi:MAG: PLP-dependent aminotransferase family protein [Pseudomonas sp.]|uniref:aminotransferase-like domain-containing protein n=1 Tax=Pseudomonas sp. TaxID=306 RepID=UPI00339817D6
MWVPRFSEHNQPMYLMVAQALEQDIARGVLVGGERLPTLKALAAALDVTPGTISRAYEEAQRRGLVVGEVGRGTFVSQRPAMRGDAPAAEGRLDLPSAQLDLSVIKPHGAVLESWLREALMRLAQSEDLTRSLDYAPEGGHPLHREAGAHWLRGALPEARWQQVVITAGAQHGLLVAMNGLTRSGDLILCEALCYPGIISLAHHSGRRLQGVAMDEQGILPEALRERCRQEKPALLVCVATCQNPTTAIMSEARRAEIAEIAREFDFLILDDDIYGFLAPTPLRPLASFAPERSVYLTSLSKSVAPALRIGYLHGPPETLSRLNAMVRSSVWMPSPLMAQLATQVIAEGLGTQLMAVQREEAAARQAIAAQVFQGLQVRSQPNSYHLWLTLPEPWSCDEFALLARANGVTLLSGSQFFAERSTSTRGVRIVLMSPTSRDELRFALTRLASMLASAEPRLYY